MLRAKSLTIENMLYDIHIFIHSKIMRRRRLKVGKKYHGKEFVNDMTTSMSADGRAKQI